ncbi:SDR family NAD(P)-dependent oxidoreductase [Labedaea rhizosphaerae]|uniref:Acyl transferase domain-containing protein n=1 Tax=Labedaea rhizosphaerae TaxID=598644 RepID=A0A4R6S758_LABRH|nr:type I polyketide synthase [Labedaea rhizosphaerae]TDP95213.1 acyl transferase domain-containing protein [Labedaea rhizosphaerae]
MTSTETTPDLDPVEPIAIIGMAARVPGARDVRQFWRNLADGVESVRRFSREEQLAAGVPEHLVDDENFVPAAPVLDDVEYFDAAFFGMTSREAQLSDPQQRLFLELAHTALEDGGYDPARYDGQIGVYGGMGNEDYRWRHLRNNPKIMASSGALSVSLGSSSDFLATFTSYKLNLRGPSFTVLTACSTSLVALHLACESLRNGECDMALAGGVCIELPLGAGYLPAEGGVLAADGHCRPFDADATGTLWGSGGGVLLVKRLSEAIEDGDDIRAVILGDAINNDGSTKVGFTAPSVDGQAEVIAQALGMADIDPRTISYVEAHGTATALGDPIEVAALTNAFHSGTDETGWCALGSVKSNIGHLSQGAGVAGVIKTVLAMRHGLIPPTLHFEKPNPQLDLPSTPFYVNATLSKWDANGTPRRAGVSSFGMGGTNAHILLEEAPALDLRRTDRRPAALLRLSARSQAALSAMLDQLATHLGEHPELDLADVAHTLRVGRAKHPHRAVVVAGDPADAVLALRDRKRRQAGIAGAQPPSVAFLFSGQGSQYPGMAAELYEHEPVFRTAVDECVDAFGETGATVRSALLDASAEEPLRGTDITQPALFAIEYGLAQLWLSWGVRPGAMIGHSIGELVAATLAGVFTLADAARLVVTRGRLMQAMPAGAMLAVRADESEIAALLPEGLSIATVNGPGTCVVAGATELVDAFAQALSDNGTSSKRLKTSHAFHSPTMDPVLDEFAAAVAAVPLRAPSMPFLSNVTGTWITGEQATDPRYWARQVRETVRFGQCVATVLAKGSWAFVECGPGKQLAGLVRMQLPKGDKDALPPLPSLPPPGEKARPLDLLYGAAGRLWTVGVDLSDDSCGASGRRVSLPTYPYERKYYWIDPAPVDAAAAAVAAPVRTGALPLDEWFSVPTWRQSVASAPASTPERFLVLGEAPDLVAALRDAGAEVVEAGDRRDYPALLADRPSRIVHARALTGDGDVLAAQDNGFFDLLELVKALAATGVEDPVHLDVLTCGAQDVTGHDLVYPEHATVAGIVKVVPLEVPALSVRHIDVDPAGARGVAAEVRRDPDELVVALRGGRRWVPDTESVSLPPADTIRAFRDEGVYVITGGLGGIGITLAEHLGAQHRAKLVLVSRSGLPPREEWDVQVGPDRAGRAIAAIRRAEQAGAEVLVVAADVTDADAMRSVRDQALARFGRVDGIVHAAGLPGGGMAEVKDKDAALRVLAPKLAGTVALRAAFGDIDLDFVVLCSSVTALSGGFGQVDYCAANAFLDATARAADTWGRVVSVNWGGWLEVGMAAESSAPAILGGHGGVPMTHPVLKTAHETWCEGVLAPETHWVLAEHRISGVPVLPGAAYLDLARAAAEQLMPGSGAVELRDVAFVEPLAVPEGTTARLRVDLAGEEFTITSTAGGPVRTHVRGTASRVTVTESTVDIEAIRARCERRDVRGSMMDSAITPGAQGPALLGFGDRWRSLGELYVGATEELAGLAAPEQVAAELTEWVLHPALLDMATSFGTPGEGAFLPLAYGKVTVRGPIPATAWSHLRYRDRQPGAEIVTADLSVVDDEGRKVLSVTDFVLRRVDIGAMSTTVHDAPADPKTGKIDEVGIRPADGVEALRRILGSDAGPQVVVSVRPLAEVFARTENLTTESLESTEDDVAERPQRIAGSDYVPPSGELETKLAALWQEVLGAGQVGADDDFFELGGNSLVAVQLIAQVRSVLGVKLPMQTLFEGATVARMAARVEQLRATQEATPAPAQTIKRLARKQ